MISTVQRLYQRVAWRHWPLALKLMLPMLAIIILTVSSLTWLTIRREQQQFQAQLEQKAALLVDGLTMAAQAAATGQDPTAPAEMLAALNGMDEILTGRIYDQQGHVLADMNTTEIMERAPHQAATSPFPQRWQSDDASIVYEWADDRLIASRTVQIDGQTVGMVQLVLSTASLNNQMATAQRESIVVAGLISLVAVTGTYLISRTIAVPLRQMTVAAQHIASGDLDQEVIVPTSDELANLAASFNNMTSQLRQTITDLQASERLAQQARDEALEASRLKSEFLATMSHELRTPLNAIIGFADLIQAGQTGPITEKTADRLARISRNSKQLLALINDILDLSKIEARRVTIQYQPFSPSQLLADMQTTMQAEADAKNIDLTTFLDERLPRVLVGDVQRLQQILWNLASNAVKFTHEGQVSIRFEWCSEAQWRIVVVDTGIGIDEAAQRYIFDKFRQGDSSARRAYGGTGLGLSIVKELAQMMGGDVMVKSERGQGSTFTVWLPLRRYAALDETGPALASR